MKLLEVQVIEHKNVPHATKAVNPVQTNTAFVELRGHYSLLFRLIGLRKMLV